MEKINTWLGENGYEHTRAGPIEEGWRPILGLIDPSLGNISIEEAHGLLYAAWGSHHFDHYRALYIGEKVGWLDQVTKATVEAAFKNYALQSDLWYGRMTPKEAGILLEGIACAGMVSETNSEWMQTVMRFQYSGACRIPHYLDHPVAHKTGDLPPHVANDVGIVYAKSGRIIISFFAMNIEEPYGEFEDRIGHLARQIVEYFDQ